MKLIRETYLNQIRPFYDVDLIKVIVGVRRAGKSILLETIMDEIIKSGISIEHIIYINFENLDFYYIKNFLDLHQEVKSRIVDDKKYYIFLDEIQHIKEFEKALSSFRASLNVSIFVTGSNSTLLSGELSTLLTGRTIEFEILPFSFLEIYDYIKWGGFPIRFDLKREEDIRRYLNGLYDNIINRDIKNDSSKFDTKLFKDVSLYILANAGKEFSIDNIINYYNANNGRKLSRQTIYNYLEKMKKAFLIHSVNKYNIVGKSALTGNNKYYAVDVGFRIINTNTVNYDVGFFLENIIYNELICRGFIVHIGKTYKGEVDFVAIKNGKKCFIQVSYLLANEETINREFGAFKPIADASPKYVMSLDKVDFSRNGIRHVNIVDFLLHKVNLELS